MVTGAVLAGGKSLRYGSNKALDVFRGKRLVDRAVEDLRAFCDPVLTVANDLTPFYDVRSALVQDVFSHQGPLGGLYSALLFSPNDWVFVKATDMPFLVPGLAVMMLAAKEGADVVTPMRNGRYEPLLALYHRRCISVIVDMLEKRERKVTSFYARAKVKELPEEAWRAVDPEALSFKNVNTPEDMEELECN